ncbi:uncharacterized protein isoform X1 [Rhodnius prolixus]|uniref:uncharacterized protein isoform X1 n=1 Tax=Rhodnius prolixus TaxID=13249 RepID=UPI003D18CB3B
MNRSFLKTLYMKFISKRLIQFTDREERRQCDRFLVNYKDFQIFQKSLVARFPSGVRKEKPVCSAQVIIILWKPRRKRLWKRVTVTLWQSWRRACAIPQIN